MAKRRTAATAAVVAAAAAPAAPRRLRFFRLLRPVAAADGGAAAGRRRGESGMVAVAATAEGAVPASLAFAAAAARACRGGGEAVPASTAKASVAVDEAGSPLAWSLPPRLLLGLLLLVLGCPPLLSLSPAAPGEITAGSTATGPSVGGPSGFCWTALLIPSGEGGGLLRLFRCSGRMARAAAGPATVGGVRRPLSHCRSPGSTSGGLAL